MNTRGGVEPTLTPMRGRAIRWRARRALRRQLAGLPEREPEERLRVMVAWAAVEDLLAAQDDRTAFLPCETADILRALATVELVHAVPMPHRPTAPDEVERRHAVLLDTMASRWRWHDRSGAAASLYRIVSTGLGREVADPIAVAYRLEVA